VELRDLRVFQAIAEEGSISRAADRLGYVQSNVTARLRRLEEELGVLLFHREPKGVRITEKGMLFRQYADSILRMAEESVRVLKDDGTPSGILRIGVVESVTCGNFIRLISRYQRQYEDVSLRLETGNTAELLQKLKNAELDAALVTGELAGANLTVDWLYTDELEQWHKDEGVTFRSFLEIRSLETLLGSVKAGLACTLLSRSVLSGAYEQLYVHPIPEKYRYIETGLVRRHESFTSSSYRVFARLVREEGV